MSPNRARRLLTKVRRTSAHWLRVWTFSGVGRSGPPTGPPPEPLGSRASAILVPHPRIEDRVEHVHEQVHQHEERSPVEGDALDHRVVPAEDGLDGNLADAGPAEDQLR